MTKMTTSATGEQPTVFVIDDEPILRDALTLLLESERLRVECFDSARAFLDVYRSGRPGCLVLDIDMPDISGLELQRVLAIKGIRIPIIFLTGQADIPAAVQALKAGAVDFLEKPANDEALLSCIHKALTRDRELHMEKSTQSVHRRRFEHLTPREREVMILMVKGKSNKEVARILEISTRTVEGHRFRIMEKMEAGSLQQLTKIAGLCRLTDRLHDTQTGW